MEAVSSSNKKPRGLVSSAGDQKVSNARSSVFLAKLEEQEKVIKELRSSLKTSEDKRKVVETRGKNLLAENHKLKSQLDAEYSKLLELQKKLNLQEARIRDSTPRPKTKDSLGRVKPTAKSLPMVKESSTQTTLLKEYNSSSPKQQRREGSGTGANADISRVEQDLQQLKELLNKREQTWTKIAERDRELRERINMLTSELSSVRQIASMRSEDLHNKCVALKSTKDELVKAKKELLLLKQFTKKLKSEARAKQPSNVEDTQSDEPLPAPEEKVAMFHKA